MKGLVVLAVLVAVACATPVPNLKSYCKTINQDQCDHYERDEVCDSAGNIYRNRCSFLVSWCKNDTLAPTKCEEDVERHESYICNFYEKEDCSRHFKLWTNKCDKKGNKYTNLCEYYKAHCEYKNIELIDCSEVVLPTADVTTTPTPLPDQLFCEFYLKSNCTLKKFGYLDVCDQHGTTYYNKCEFRKAWCLNTTLEANDCSWDHSGDYEGSGALDYKEETDISASKEAVSDYEYDPEKEKDAVVDKEKLVEKEKNVDKEKYVVDTLEKDARFVKKHSEKYAKYFGGKTKDDKKEGKDDVRYGKRS